ncbi:hypothetical protein [Nocardia sp. JMUB6875]
MKGIRPGRPTVLGVWPGVRRASGRIAYCRIAAPGGGWRWFLIGVEVRDE